MSLPWITLNLKLQEGITLINSLNKNKFSLLLKHIVEIDNENPFTEDELGRLSESLKLDSLKLQLLIKSVVHIFKQSSKFMLKPTVLQEQLTEILKFDHEKAEEFVKVWTQETNKNFNLENAKNLEKISWELNVQSASSFCSKQQQINSRLQLGLSNVDGKEKENITLELNEEELLHLYNVLENVQNKLDNMK